MISTSFKKQLIVNSYNTQFNTDEDEIKKIFLSNIKYKKNLLLFKKNVGILIKYKYNPIDIGNNILWLLSYLTYPFYSVYNYSDKITDIQNTQEDILSNIEYALDRKHRIEDNPDYVEYLEDIYD